MLAHRHPSTLSTQLACSVNVLARGASSAPIRQLLHRRDHARHPTPRYYRASARLQLQKGDAQPDAISRQLDRFDNVIAKARVTDLETIKLYELDAPSTGVIRILSLNRQAARNALSRKLLYELRDQIQSIHSEGLHGSTRALVLASEVDSVFCAGADLKERKGMSMDEVATFLKDLRSTFAQIDSLPVPCIASVSSLALGGGLELALCAHVRVFASTAVVGLPETRLAIIPGAGGTYRLPRIVGRARALDLVLSGRRVDGATALAWGLCTHIAMAHDPQSTTESVKPDQNARHLALLKSIDVAHEICEGGPVALRAAIQAIEGGNEAAENAAYDMILPTEDRLEALKAFGEKRKPKFAGR